MRKPVTMGRPKRVGEILSEERKIKFAPTMYEALEDRAATTGMSISEQVRRAVASHLEGAPPDDDAPGLILKILAQAPCGPWAAAIEEGGDFALSRQLARELQAMEGDVLVRTSGESMVAAGIATLEQELSALVPVAEVGQPRDLAREIAGKLAHLGKFLSAPDVPASAKHQALSLLIERIDILPDGGLRIGFRGVQLLRTA